MPQTFFQPFFRIQPLIFSWFLHVFSKLGKIYENYLIIGGKKICNSPPFSIPINHIIMLFGHIFGVANRNIYKCPKFGAGGFVRARIYISRNGGFWSDLSGLGSWSSMFWPLETGAAWEKKTMSRSRSHSKKNWEPVPQNLCGSCTGGT